MREMKGANDLKYVVFTALMNRCNGPCCNPRVRARTCESRGMKIYHTAFITVDGDSRFELRLTRGARFSPRGDYICHPRRIEESRRAMMIKDAY